MTDIVKLQENTWRITKPESSESGNDKGGTLMGLFFGRVRRFTQRKLKNTEGRNNVTMQKEDFLMKQIDEFKDKAKQLQLLLKSKEQQVNELENMVNDREARAQELEELLQLKRTEADELVAGVSAQIQEMIQALDRQMEQLQTSVNEQIDRQVKTLEEKLDTVKDLDEKLDAMKADIYDKVHNEDVKCYRNMKSLIEGQNEKFDDVILSRESLKAIQKSFKGLKFFAFFAFLDFIFLIVFALYKFGIFDRFLM